MFDIGYKTNEIVSHDELCKKTRCGCMGGIRYSIKNNVLVLFINKNSQYCNSWNNGVLHYMGCGKGNQSLAKRGNSRLAEAKKNNTAVCVFEWVDTTHCKYLGRMILAGKPYFELRENKFGEMENKIIFPLKEAE